MEVFKLLDSGSNQLRSKNINSHKLDTEILLSKTLKRKREQMLINFNQKVTKNNIKRFEGLIKRRLSREPIAYILKEKEFWSKKFFVNKDVLIPRPETELMVEKILNIYKSQKINILDVGTGSGCILLSILSELKNSKGIGIDISLKAINIAKQNQRRHGLRNITKFCLKSIEKFSGRNFDVIVSNPPYIKRKDIKNLDEDIKKFEPKIALDGGNDGLDVIKKVIYKAKNILKNKGTLSLEIGKEQHKKVLKILQSNNFLIKYIVKDYKDNIRCIISTLNI